MTGKKKKTDPTKPCTGFQIQVHQDEIFERDPNSVGRRSLVASQQPGLDAPRDEFWGWAAKIPPCLQPKIWVCTVRGSEGFSVK